MDRCERCGAPEIERGLTLDVDSDELLCPPCMDIRDRCPDCGALVDVAYDGAAHCPDHRCGWWTE